MKRILLMVFRNILLVPYMWFRLCYVAAHADKYPEQNRYDMLRFIVHRANKGGNVLAIVDACETPFSVVAKKEVENVQFLKQVFACMKAFTMDRSDLRQSMQVIMNVTKEVENGRNYCIFAEGTRSKLGNKLLEFKGGSFKAATKAKCPIVPVALVDSFKPFDTNSIAPVTVQVHFLQPLLYEEYKDMKTNEIAEIVRKRIADIVEKV